MIVSVGRGGSYQRERSVGLRWGGEVAGMEPLD